MPKKIGLFVAMLVAAIGGTLFWNRSQVPPAVELVSAVAGTLDLSFTAEGFVKGRSYDLSPDFAGRVAWLGVREGDTVSAGEELLRLDTTDLDQEREQALATRSTAQRQVSEALAAYQAAGSTARAMQDGARARVAEAEANLRRVMRGTRPEAIDQARHQIERLEAAEREAKQGLDRAQMLHAQGAISTAALQSAQAQYQAAVAQLEQARDALAELQAGALPEEREAAQAQLRQARANLKLALEADQETKARLAQVETARSRVHEADHTLNRISSRIQKASLRAPVAGTVVKLAVEVGATAAPGAVAVQVATREDLRVEAEIQSEDLGGVRVGSQVAISLPSQPGRETEGVIERLSAAAEPKPDAAIRTRIVRARIRVLKPTPDFVPGLEVDVRIVDQRKVAVSVPNDAVVVAGAQTSVWMVENGVLKRREVAIGASDARSTEILSGLAAGEQVVLKVPEGLQEGAQVGIVDARR